MGRLGAVDMEEPKTSVFAPFETVFLARREAILRLVGVSSYALRSMSGAAHLSEVLNYEAQHVEHIRKIEEIAASEVSLDFPLLHSAGTVLLWGALESAFRDFVVRWLTCYPLARQVPELKKVRVSVAEYEFSGRGSHALPRGNPREGFGSRPSPRCRPFRLHSEAFWNSPKDRRSPPPKFAGAGRFTQRDRSSSGRS